MTVHKATVHKATVHEATVRWERGPGEAFTDNRYTRAHEWRFDGGAVVPASASPHNVRVPFADPAAVDPEEAFVAALSSCHMLFFLAFAAARGLAVDTYMDAAQGRMAKAPDGREWLDRVILRPRIAFDGDRRPTPAEIEALHHAAHEACFLANSVKSEVVVEPPPDP